MSLCLRGESGLSPFLSKARPLFLTANCTAVLSDLPFASKQHANTQNNRSFVSLCVGESGLSPLLRTRGPPFLTANCTGALSDLPFASTNKHKTTDHLRSLIPVSRGGRGGNPLASMDAVSATLRNPHTPPTHLKKCKKRKQDWRRASAECKIIHSISLCPRHKKTSRDPSIRLFSINSSRISRIWRRC